MIEDFSTTITRVAREVGRSYLNYTSIPDIEQELWVFVLERQEYFEKYPATVWVAFRRAAHRFCEAQRNAALPGPPEPDLYSPKVVRALLEDCFNYEDWQSFSQKGDDLPKARRLEATSDRLAMLVDVKSAVDKVTQRQYSILIAKFKLGWSDAQIAEMLEIETQSVATQVSRSVKAVADQLNPKNPGHEYTGRRRVKSNAAARAELEVNW